MTRLDTEGSSPKRILSACFDQDHSFFFIDVQFDLVYQISANLNSGTVFNSPFISSTRVSAYALEIGFLWRQRKLVVFGKRKELLLNAEAPQSNLAVIVNPKVPLMTYNPQNKLSTLVFLAKGVGETPLSGYSVDQLERLFLFGSE